jgi:hypothetical protein
MCLDKADNLMFPENERGKRAITHTASEEKILRKRKQ